MEQELRISQRAKQYPASGIRKMFDLAAQYPEAIKLTVGEPNFDTPQYIKDAAKRALDEGQTHYAPNAGTTELREAVAAKYRKQYWEGYTKDHVIITVGAMEGLFLAHDFGPDGGAADDCLAWRRKLIAEFNRYGVDVTSETLTHPFADVLGFAYSTRDDFGRDLLFTGCKDDPQKSAPCIGRDPEKWNKNTR